MTRHTTNLELFPRRWERALTPEEVRAGFERLRRAVAEAVRERAGGKAELSRDEVDNDPSSATACKRQPERKETDQ